MYSSLCKPNKLLSYRVAYSDGYNVSTAVVKEPGITLLKQLNAALSMYLGGTPLSCLIRPVAIIYVSELALLPQSPLPRTI